MRNNKIQRIIKNARKKPFYINKYKNIEKYSFDKLPFVNSKEIQSIYADSKKADSTVFFTSGTTSDPKAFYYSDSDIKYITDYIKWFCYIEKAIKNEKVIVLMDQSFWGVGHMTSIGHIKAGNTVIPVDNDLPLPKIKEIIRAVKPTVISSLPSILLEIRDIIGNYKFNIIETTGEKLNNKERKRIEKIYGGEVYDAYGLTEAVIGVECNQHNGYHFDQDKIKLDIVDPLSKKFLQENEWGELVITTLNTDLKSTSMIKYLSGDKCKISYKQCSCGLIYPRVWIDGRIKPTVDFHEGYKMEIDEIKKMVNLTLGEGSFIRSEILKINGSKYLLKIVSDTRPTKENQKKIKNQFVKYSFELMHMIRNSKLVFKFEKK